MNALPQNLKNALNNQMNLERLNEAYYDALSLAMQVLNFDGSAKFFEKSAREEHSHYALFAKYLIERNEIPALEALPRPTVAPGNSLLIAFEAAQERERITTVAIDTLYDLSQETGDNQTLTFLIPLLNEQTSSERELFDIVAMIQRAGSGLGEQWIDHEIGEGEIPSK